MPSETKSNFVIILKIFIMQLINPLVIVLLASFILSLILKEYSEKVTIKVTLLDDIDALTVKEAIEFEKFIRGKK